MYNSGARFTVVGERSADERSGRCERKLGIPVKEGDACFVGTKNTQEITKILSYLRGNCIRKRSAAFVIDKRRIKLYSIGEKLIKKGRKVGRWKEVYGRR